jgi:hypothetical protein
MSQAVTRSGRGGLGSRVRPEGRHCGVRRADAGGRLRSAGEAREATRRQRYAGTKVAENKTLRGHRPARRSETIGVNRWLPRRVGRVVRSVPRREGDHFENKIRELQTSVEWTGVATGLRPTQTREVPVSTLGAPRGKPQGEGGLARRTLRTSDVERRRAPDDRKNTKMGTRSVCRTPNPS